MRRLILFAKRPRKGRVKTRLAAELGRDATLALYRAFLDDQIRFLRGFAGRHQVELCLDGVPDADLGLDRLASLCVTKQGPGDLGRRLLRAFRRSRRAGARATVVIGADAPTLPRSLVDGAFRELDRGRPAVVAPADDGGYVLLGMDRPRGALLHGVPWGGSRVLAVTRRRAAAAGLGLRELAGWYDVDDLASLARLEADLARPEAARRAPATAAWLGRRACGVP
jgi:rSAM/selenodomain-associated transferase 1